MMIKISVIIPIYKVEKYLRQCIDSIVNQTYTDLEIILVDDESPDRCPEICDEYAEKDNRICVIHKKNGGASDARCCGLTKATGDYIMFVDGDDWLDTNIIEECVGCINRPQKPDCVIFTYVREYPNNSIITHIMDYSGELTGTDAEDRVYRRLYGLIGNELNHPERLENMGSCCMKVYKREFARNGRFYDISEIGSSEDIVYNMFALYGCQRIVYIDRPAYHYRKMGNSITSSYRPNLMRQWNRLYDIMEDIISDKELGPKYTCALNVRIALSVFGIGINELYSKKTTLLDKIGNIRGYIETKRYMDAINEVDLSLLPLPWKTMMLFAKYKMVYLLYLELVLIDQIRRRF